MPDTVPIIPGAILRAGPYTSVFGTAGYLNYTVPAGVAVRPLIPAGYELYSWSAGSVIDGTGLLIIRPTKIVQPATQSPPPVSPPPAPVPPPPAPPPPPPAAPPTDPNLIKVPVGQSWVAAAKAAKPGQTVQLAEGTWTEGLIDTNIRLAGVKIIGAGRGKTRVQVADGAAIVAWCWDDCSIGGISFGCDKTTDSGVQFWGCHGCTLDSSEVSGFRMNVIAETANAHGSSRACENITISNNYIHHSTPLKQGDGWSDSSGVYADTTVGITLSNNIFDHNGWSEPAVGNAPATCPGTERNHNLYLRADNVQPVLVTGNVFSRASSHGAQVRCGGKVVANKFVDNPIHLSVGLVNGAGPIVVGGVTAEVRGNVFCGTRPLAGEPRGYGMEVSNAREIAITGNTFAGIHQPDPHGPIVAAIKLDVCALLPSNPFFGKDVTVLKATIAGNVVTWPKQPLWIHPKIDQANVTAQTSWPSADVAGTRAAIPAIR